MSIPTPRRQVKVALASIALALSTAGVAPLARADPPPIAPPPPPVIGPLQYGPPGYPPTIGVPLLPPGRSGVSISSDSLSPDQPPTPGGSRGISGVNVGADALMP